MAGRVPGPVLTDKDATAAASAWIGRSPTLIGALDWHVGLCPACDGTRFCAEYTEIICEYGAGPYGAAVFFPDERKQVTTEQQVETRGGESPADWQVNTTSRQYRYEHYDPRVDVGDAADD